MSHTTHKHDDGGPAFPVFTTDAWGQSFVSGGMTLRDWFAGQPLTELEYGLLRDAYFAAHSGIERVSLQTLRYFHADAMLKARSTTSPSGGV